MWSNHIIDRIFYVFFLACSREKVYIEVEDVDEFAPYWKQDMYMAEVEEGRLFNQIVRQENADKACHDQIVNRLSVAG